MEGVREALATAQEAGDTACLAHAAAWGALAGGRARRAALLTKMPRAPRPAAAAAQLLAQHAAVNGATPSDVFQVGVPVPIHLFTRARLRPDNRHVPTRFVTHNVLVNTSTLYIDNKQRRLHQLHALADRSHHGQPSEYGGPVVSVR